MASPGIDVADALRLLASRPCDGSGACPCHARGPALNPADLDVCPPAASAAPEAGTAVVVAHDMSGMGPVELVRLVQQLQTERVESYGAFERGFVAFLERLDGAAYEMLCAQLTAEFAHASAGINAAEAALSSQGADGAALATLVRALQGLEQRKLSVTVELQLVRREARVAELRAEFDSGAGEALARAREQTALLRSGLDGLVDEINEAMDDLQCEMGQLCDVGADAGEDDA